MRTLFLIAALIVGAWSSGAGAQPSPDGTVPSSQDLFEFWRAGQAKWSTLGTIPGTGVPAMATLPSAGLTGVTMMTVNTSDSASFGPWQITGKSFPGVNPDGRPDHVMNIGWNIGPNGAPFILGQPAARIGMESHFDENASVSFPAFEMHLASFYDTTGLEYRPISVEFLYNQKQATLSLQSQTYNFFDSTNTNQFLVVTSNGATANAGATWNINGNSAWVFSVNNIPVMQQVNAALDGFNFLPYYTNTNDLLVRNPGNGSSPGGVIFESDGNGKFVFNSVGVPKLDYGISTTGRWTFAGGGVAVPALIGNGATPTLTGSCVVVAGTQHGGNTVGDFTIPAGNCAATTTVIMAFATTAPTGYACDAHNLNTPTSIIDQTAKSATGATFTIRSVTSNAADVVTFKCMAY